MIARGSVTPSGHASRRSRLSGSVGAAAPLLGVLGDRATVVHRARGADPDARLRARAPPNGATSGAIRSSVSRVGLDAGLEQPAQRVALRPLDDRRPATLRDDRAEPRGEPLGLRRRVGPDALQRHAVGPGELRDDALVLGVEARRGTRHARRRPGT